MNGREALKAILDCDADIDFFCDYENNWCPVVQSMWSVHKIKNADFNFRIRPKTVLELNGSIKNENEDVLTEMEFEIGLEILSAKIIQEIEE